MVKLSVYFNRRVFVMQTLFPLVLLWQSSELLYARGSDHLVAFLLFSQKETTFVTSDLLFFFFFFFFFCARAPSPILKRGLYCIEKNAPCEQILYYRVDSFSEGN